MVFVSKIYSASLVMLGFYQKCVFIMTLEGYIYIFLGIGYEIGSLNMTQAGFELFCIGY